MAKKEKDIPDDPTHEDNEDAAAGTGNYAGPLESDSGNQESYRKAPHYYPEAGSAQRGTTGRYQTGWSGVGGVHREDNRGKGPKGYTRSDERIHEDVCENLTADRDVDASEIEVTVDGGEVTLDGAIRSKHEKRCAEDCADAVSGVQHVQNNLRARHSGQGHAVNTGQGRDRES